MCIYVSGDTAPCLLSLSVLEKQWPVSATGHEEEARQWQRYIFAVGRDSAVRPAKKSEERKEEWGKE
jgi:hypothetical protein